ncbi:MAG: YdcF family protein, partial [Spirochaetaceae bacterium]
APEDSGEDGADDAEARINAASHIVVLGGGTVQGSPEAPEGTLKPDAMKRAVYGHQLHMAYGRLVVLTGGPPAGYPDAPSEARVAADLLLSLGSTEEQLLLEAESRDTWENARYVDAMICNETVILVTSAYHMARAVRSFAAHGFTVVPAPTDYKAKRGGYSFLSFLPSIESLRNSSIALHEYLGILYYRLRTPDPEDAVVR